MAHRKSSGTSKITRGTTAPKRAQRPQLEATKTAPPAVPAEIHVDDIRRRAYEKFIARGCLLGNAVGDWLAAETELREAAR